MVTTFVTRLAGRALRQEIANLPGDAQSDPPSSRWTSTTCALIANVHPPDWVNPEPAARYHLVVIGAGTAGLVSAAGAAGLGARVALIERHLMGGDCLNVGCVPSKGVIRAARAWQEAREAAERFGGPAVADGAGRLRRRHGADAPAARRHQRPRQRRRASAAWGSTSSSATAGSSGRTRSRSAASACASAAP